MNWTRSALLSLLLLFQILLPMINTKCSRGEHGVNFERGHLNVSEKKKKKKKKTEVEKKEKKKGREQKKRTPLNFSSRPETPPLSPLMSRESR